MDSLKAFLLMVLTVFCQLSYGEEIHEEVYNGYNASPGQFPYQALLTIVDSQNRAYTCGGSLISRRHVLTAAHCTFEGAYTIVKLGVTDQRTNTGVVSYRVLKSGMIVHPQYNPNTLSNDISILVLPSNVTFTNLIKTVNLPKLAWANASTFDNYQVTISGFGAVVDNGSAPQQNLQFREIHKMPQASCAKFWGSGLTNGNICTDKTVYAGPCPGDSGGPLTVQVQSVLYEIGLVSYGVQNPDCSARSPEVYTNVAAFLRWINSVTGIPIS